MCAQASQSHGIFRAFTGVHIIGGAEINCDDVNINRLPDFKVEGGSIFKGGVAALDDVCVLGSIYGNITGNFSGTLLGNIVVEGELDVGGNITAIDGMIANLETDVLCVTDELFVDVISSKEEQMINIGNIELAGNIIPEADIVYTLGSSTHKFKTVYTEDLVVSGVVSGNLNVDLGNITSLTLETLTANVIESNIVCINTELLTDIIGPKTGNGIFVDGNVLPTGNIATDLGSNALRWQNIYTQDLIVSNIHGYGPITIETDVLPSLDLTYSFGSQERRWNTIFANEIDVVSNLTANVVTTDVMNANVGCVTEIQTGLIVSKGGSGDIFLSGNIIPTSGSPYSIGNTTNKIENIVVNDLVVCGTLSGNVNIDTGNIANLTLELLTSNIVCVNNDIQVDVINEKTMDNGVSIDGVILKDLNVTSEVLTANIIDTPYLLDYKRVIVNTNMYNITQSDDIIAVTSTTLGTVTLVLPLINTMFRKRKKFTIVDEGGHAGANAITIMTSGSDTIFTGTSWMLNGDFNAVQLYSNEIDKWFAI